MSEREKGESEIGGESVAGNERERERAYSDRTVEISSVLL